MATYIDRVGKALNYYDTLDFRGIDVLKAQIYLNLLGFAICILILALDGNNSDCVLV